MLSTTDDLRISELKELSTPQEVMREIPRTLTATRVVMAARNAIHAILNGTDDRLLVVVGPCSVHDPVAAVDYAERLAALREELADRLEIVMRVYFEKPRTTVGWKGLINDPNLDGSFDINRGLRLARNVLSAVNNLGLPAGTEFLGPTAVLSDQRSQTGPRRCRARIGLPSPAKRKLPDSPHTLGASESTQTVLAPPSTMPT